MSITTTADTPRARGASMSDIRIVRQYPHPPAKVWRALTDPALVALWGMRPEGFEPAAGNRFKLVAKPQPGWRGFVECEVLEARAPKVLRYSWLGDDKGDVTEVTYTLEPRDGGTRLTFLHAGFKGVGGWMLAKLMMGPGWKSMLAKRFPAVLADIDEEGKLREGSTLTPKF
jgi:uncharacterized protein YndB with AHSA1/START domain